MIEKSLVLIKPDGVQRKLIGKIITRLENKGLKIVAMKYLQVSDELAKKHYSVHEGKTFFDSLIEFITSSPIVAMVLEGENAISLIRKIVGATKPEESLPGTIRGDYAISTQHNLIHASDSIESSNYEISNFFKEEEIVNIKFSDKDWL